MLPFSIFSGEMLVHSCLSVLLTVISLIVFTCTVTYELISLNDDDDDDDDDEYIISLYVRVCYFNGKQCTKYF